MLKRYVVVFLGYAADDPPMQYLLEGLSRDVDALNSVYAFHAGSEEEADARWIQKGATPIPYASSPDHSTLWNTLAAWAKRARDPDRWHDELIVLSANGPEPLRPHERGQLAHIVSTLEGARRFAQADPSPPASWLYSFDPSIRYGDPGKLGRWNEDEPSFDPYEAYGLDTDPAPEPFDPENAFRKREIPNGVWDCFALTRHDKQNLRDTHLSALRGYLSINEPFLVPRLDSLGTWIAKTANQPATVWWAAAQIGVHPEIQKRIKYSLDGASPPIRLAWQRVFESFANKRPDFFEDWYDLAGTVKSDGWTPLSVRRFAAIHQPLLKVEKSFFRAPRAPEDQPKVGLHQLISVKIEYPHHNEPITVSYDLLATLVQEFRKNLEFAVALETELGSHGLSQLNAIESMEPDAQELDRDHGIEIPLSQYVRFFDLLKRSSPRAAKNEIQAWWGHRDPVFTQLKLWCLADNDLVPDASEELATLPQEAFWNSRHQSNLLMTLARRWYDVWPHDKAHIEHRLLRGPPRWKNESRSNHRKRRAWTILNRIHWLSEYIKFDFDLEKVTTPLRKDASDWEPRFAKGAADSLRSRSGFVQTDTSSDSLRVRPETSGRIG